MFLKLLLSLVTILFSIFVLADSSLNTSPNEIQGIELVSKVTSTEKQIQSCLKLDSSYGNDCTFKKLEQKITESYNQCQNLCRSPLCFKGCRFKKDQRILKLRDRLPASVGS